MTRKLAVAVCFLAALAAFGQKKDNKKNQPETPTFKIVVNLVDFELVAVDKAGNPVTDLKPEEVTIFEDDKPRPLKTFTLLSAGKDTGAASAYRASIKESLAKLPPTVSTNMSALPPLLDQPVYTIVLLDTLNTPVDVKAQARRKMVEMLNTLNTSQPIAIYGLTNSLMLLQDFTTDRDLLKKAIQEANAPGQTEHKDGKIIDHATSNAAAAAMDGLPSMQQTVENIRSMEYEMATNDLELRVRTTSIALQALARRLQGIPGRKNLVWVTAMFPEYILPDPEIGKGGFNTIDRVGRMPDWIRPYMDQNALALEAAHISVYPVDASGLQNRTFGIDSDQHSENLFTKYVPGQTGSSLPNASMESAERHNAMERIASLTGGRAFHDRNDLDNAMKTAINEGSTYYTVAFTPAEQFADGKVHALKLTTTRKNVTLRYRTGFLEFDPSSTSNQQTRAIDEAFQSAIVYQRSLSTGVIAFVRKSETPGTVDVSIDPRTIFLAQGQNGKYRLLIDVATAAFDSGGKLLKDSTIGKVIDLSLDETQKETVMSHGVRFLMSASQAQGAKRLRIGICDRNNGRIGTVDLDLQ